MSNAAKLLVLLIAMHSATLHAQEHTHSHEHPAPAVGPVLPPITDADLAAAFPETGSGHAAHDVMQTFLLFDQLEWQRTEDDANALNWDVEGWMGKDLHRLWLRAEGERAEGHTDHSEIQALWGRRFSRWWELVAGARHDFAPGASQSWAAVGVQGLAPYGFEIEATAFLGEGGRTAARLAAEYELRVTNRLIAQPLVELNFHGKSDPARGIASGLSTAEAGLRLRYEIRRELAPYIGISWVQSSGEDSEDTRAVAGLRLWF